MAELAWRRLLLLLLRAGILVFLLLIRASAASALQGEGVLRPGACPSCAYRDPLMDPTHAVWRGSHDFVWQLPPARPPRAVLLLVHGEKQDPFLYFDPGPKCRACYGLPEGRRIVLDALRRGYAVIALKSASFVWDTWPLEGSRDVAMVKSILSAWRRERALEDLPLVAWGHSAGGAFASGLTEAMPLQGLVLAVSEGQSEVIQRATPGKFPPTFFTYMLYENPGGHTTSKSVEDAMETLARRRVPVAGKMVAGKVIGPMFFSERIRCMSDALSERVYDALREEGLVDDGGRLDPLWAYGDWRSVLSRALPQCWDEDPCLSKGVRQELTVAEGGHGMTSDTDSDIFSFLEAQVLQVYNGISMGLESSANWGRQLMDG